MQKHTKPVAGVYKNDRVDCCRLAWLWLKQSGTTHAMNLERGLRAQNTAWHVRYTFVAY